MSRPYPPDFAGWTQEKQNAFFAEEARDYREASGNGAAKPIDTDADLDAERPFGTFGTSKGGGFSDGEAGTNWTMVLTCASSVKPEPIRWLWQNWLARGKMHIVAGQPGVGKSTLAMKMAATVSAGSLWTDGGAAEKGNVVIWSGEDYPADTLVPRLEASGADLSRIFFAGELTCGKERRAFDPAKDIPALQAAIVAAGGATLIVVDPIVSATSADSHKNSETRRGLQPLVDMATELDAALLGITHFTKGSEGRSPIDRVTGSVAFGALARVVMVAARQQDNDDGKSGQRILMRAKSNIGPDEGGFEYDLQLVPMRDNPDIVASVISWGNAIDGTARDVLAIAESSNDNGAGSAFNEAKDFLLDFLMDSPKPAKEVQVAARAAGHSWATIRRAKDELDISSVKSGDGGTWVWQFPQGAHQNSRCPNPKNMSTLSTLSTFKKNQLVSDEQDAQQKGQDAQHAQGAHHFGVERLEQDDNENAAQAPPANERKVIRI